MIPLRCCHGQNRSGVGTELHRGARIALRSVPLDLNQATPLGLPQWFTGFCTTEPFVSRDTESCKIPRATGTSPVGIVYLRARAITRQAGRLGNVGARPEPSHAEWPQLHPQPTFSSPIGFESPTWKSSRKPGRNAKTSVIKRRHRRLRGHSWQTVYQRAIRQPSREIRRFFQAIAGLESFDLLPARAATLMNVKAFATGTVSVRKARRRVASFENSVTGAGDHDLQTGIRTQASLL